MLSSFVCSPAWAVTWVASATVNQGELSSGEAAKNECSPPETRIEVNEDVGNAEGTRCVGRVSRPVQPLAAPSFRPGEVFCLLEGF